MHSPKFTIILAGYQTEPYLSKALESISQQTFHDFEAICYVEESTDHSLEICREWARGDSRFLVATGPKSGAVATTRNYGIYHATGEYLVAIDGDDWVATDMLEKLAMKLERTGPVDVLAFAFVTTTDDTLPITECPRYSNFRPEDDDSGVFSGADAIRRAGRISGHFDAHTVASAYRVAFLRKHQLFQSDGLLMEDFEWTPRVWFAAVRFAYLDAALYVYRRRPNSLTTEASPRIAIHVAMQLRSFLHFLQGKSIPRDILVIWGNQWLSLLFWFLFHPVSSRKISDSDRRYALNRLLEGDGGTQLARLVTSASFPKRLAWPLVRLAAYGCQLPAKIFFRRVYYPLIARRAKQ